MRACVCVVDYICTVPLLIYLHTYFVRCVSLTSCTWKRAYVRARAFESVRVCACVREWKRERERGCWVGGELIRGQPAASVTVTCLLLNRNTCCQWSLIVCVSVISALGPISIPWNPIQLELPRAAVPQREREREVTNSCHVIVSVHMVHTYV
jgi:hypothetical protein